MLLFVLFSDSHSHISPDLFFGFLSFAFPHSLLIFSFFLFYCTCLSFSLLIPFTCSHIHPSTIQPFFSLSLHPSFSHSVLSLPLSFFSHPFSLSLHPSLSPLLSVIGNSRRTAVLSETTFYFLPLPLPPPAVTMVMVWAGKGRSLHSLGYHSCSLPFLILSLFLSHFLSVSSSFFHHLISFCPPIHLPL